MTTPTASSAAEDLMAFGISVTVPDLTIRSSMFHLEFTGVTRKNVQKRDPSGGHDNRDTVPAIQWSGILKLSNHFRDKVLYAKFCTDAFQVCHVERLVSEGLLPIIAIGIVRNKLYRMRLPHSDQNEKSGLTNILAGKIFESAAFQGYKQPGEAIHIHLKPLKLDDDPLVTAFIRLHRIDFVDIA